MSLKVLATEIRRDVTSTTAQYVFDNLNDGEFTNVNQVPRFRYTSLSHLCSAYGSLSDIVYYELGVASKKTNTIALQQIDVDDFPEIADTDTIDAEGMAVRILVKLSSNNLATISAAEAQYETMVDIGLRLKYILDTRCRQIPTNQFIVFLGDDRRDPDTSIDKTINPDQDYLIKFIQSKVPTATEQSHLLKCNFSRAYGS